MFEKSKIFEKKTIHLEITKKSKIFKMYERIKHFRKSKF